MGRPAVPTDSSGFRELLGYRLVEWREDHAELELDIGPQHLNRAGWLHGGVPATLLDATLGYAGCWCGVSGRRRRSVTLSLTTSYVSAVKEGLLVTTADKIGGGRHVFFARGEVRDASGRLVATAEGTYRYRRGSETPEGEPAA